MRSLSALIEDQLSNIEPGRIFLECDGDRMTYAQLGEVICGLQGLFSERGLTVGCNIGVLAHHPADVAALTLAAFRAGLAIVVLNPDFKEGEIARVCNGCNLKLLFCEVGFMPNIPRFDETVCVAFTGWPGKRKGTGLLGRLRRKTEDVALPTLEMMAAAAPVTGAPETVEGDRVALLLNTSGTTSAPKVVELTHDNIAHQLEAFDKVYGFDAASRILNPLPLHFTDCLLEHHGIAEAAAFGMPHGVWGEQIAAAIVLKAGAAPDRSDVLRSL